MQNDYVQIDGSYGEGGGQILRTCLGLAAAMGINVRISNIRANRPQGGGLRPQHLAAAKAAAEVCRGELKGAELGSRELQFRPGPPIASEYRFDVGTAGSTCLVLQTVLPALMVAEGDSKVTIIGGTHNPMAPCFEYMRDVFFVLASGMNLQASLDMSRPGFFPKGGGEILMQVGGLDSPDNIAPLRLMQRGQLRRLDGFSAVSGSLPSHILLRQARQAENRLLAAGLQPRLEQHVWETLSPGTVVFLRAVFSRSVAAFFCLGEIGKPAEKVADDALSPLLEFFQTDATVDCHAADQLITLAAMCGDESHFTTNVITNHLLTNAQVIRLLTGRQVRIEGQTGGPGKVVVEAI